MRTYCYCLLCVIRLGGNILQMYAYIIVSEKAIHFCRVTLSRGRPPGREVVVVVGGAPGVFRWSLPLPRDDGHRRPDARVGRSGRHRDTCCLWGRQRAGIRRFGYREPNRLFTVVLCMYVYLFFVVELIQRVLVSQNGSICLRVGCPLKPRNDRGNA